MFNLHFDQHFIIFDGNTFQNYISHKKINKTNGEYQQRLVNKLNNALGVDAFTH